MTLAVIVSLCAVGLSVLSLLFGQGVVGRNREHYANQKILAADQVRLERDVKETSQRLNAVETQIALTNQSVQEMMKQITKLDLLPILNAKLDMILPVVSNAVPRPEFMSLKEQVESIAEEVHSKP